MDDRNSHDDPHAHEGDDHAHDDHGHGGVGKYLAVFGGLIMLTIASFAIGQTLMETPTIAWTAMIAVSCMKALLVIMFFMHLKWEANWKYVLTVPASIMSIFLMLMLVPDIGMRTLWYSQERELHAATPEPGGGGVEGGGEMPDPSSH